MKSPPISHAMQAMEPACPVFIASRPGPLAFQKTASGPWRQRGASALVRGKGPTEQLAWLSLAVTSAEGQPLRTNVNLDGRLWTPANGFEDRGRHQPPYIPIPRLE